MLIRRLIISRAYIHGPAALVSYLARIVEVNESPRSSRLTPGAVFFREWCRGLGSVQSRRKCIDCAEKLTASIFEISHAFVIGRVCSTKDMTQATLGGANS